MKAINKKLFRDIMGLKWQIATLALLVACGISIFIASWSAYVSLRQARDLYYAENNFADLFSEIVRAPISLIAQIQNSSFIEIAEGRTVIDGLVDLYDQPEPALGRFISHSPLFQLNKIYLRQGRLPQPGSNTEILVHESFANAHRLRPGDELAIRIKGQKHKVHVTGIALSPEYIYALSPISPFPDDRHFGVFWIDHQTLSRWADLEGSFNSLIAKKIPNVSTEQAKKFLDSVLNIYGGLGAYDRDNQISNMFVQDEIRQQRSMTYIAPGVFIFVASFILYTVLSRLIELHRNQIAALKSLGYTSKSLVYHYWKLVTVILIAGIAPAILMAQGIGQWYAKLYRDSFHFPQIDFSLSPEAVFLGMISATLPAWIFSGLALKKVFSMQPAEAMRPPSPASYSLSRWEAWSPFHPEDTLLLLILRNIILRPWRTFLSVLGISAATAILINGSFWSDMIDFVIQRQFYESSREDLEVRFLHPRRQEALQELQRLPGIIMIEGTRSAGVKLIFQNISKNTAILAVQNSEGLRRFLDSSGSAVLLKPNQALLSQYFQKRYHIQLGDTIFLEWIDKSHPGFWITVGGFVEDVVGSSVYIQKEDLHRYLGESPHIDTVYIKADPAKTQELYIRLRDYPEVAAVSIKKMLLHSFTKTLSGMILTLTIILVIFAVCISGAVLFNMARINLSEKSWELASMRIMGFKESEVFRILFLELGIYIFIALPPGLLMGYGLSYLNTKWIHTDTFNFPLVIEPETYGLALVVIITVYFATGFFLFQKVRKLDLTGALKARE